MDSPLAEPRRVKQANPFYECVKDYLQTSSLEERLNSSPLGQTPIQSLSIQERFELLDRMQDEMFEPTTTAVDIASRICRMLSRGLQSMDPTNAGVRKFTMTLARNSGVEMSKLPWFSTYAMGMTVKGPTGVGKTYEIQRALKLIPQRVDHNASEAAGWTHIRQAVWLFVPMSHDGSLGGLLFQILCSLDEAIETGYSSDKSLTSLTNEKLAVRIGILLRKHGVGLLVIDEIQSRNFSDNPRGTLAATFFLRLLNFGIPTVLIGNQLGFAALEKFSQDIRRLSAGGVISMDPHSVDDWDWEECLTPAIWKFCVMPNQEDRSFMRPDVLFKFSGGIRDYACRCWIAAQRLALEAERNAVSEADLEMAFIGSDFGERDRQIIAGFRDKNHQLLSHFSDIDWEYYGKKWGHLKEPKASTAGRSGKQVTESGEANQFTESGSAAEQRPKPERDKSRIQRKRTQESRQKERRKQAKQDLNPDDIRGNGLQKSLISGFEAIRKKNA
ncbi:MAG TPA: ATP-binding protein [Noviherbaspirillum sp.]|uniref:ATP-binding protein n=1 Tax=Noviherbaspirillum sp. TaxID=1926288 RepID=UPI002B479B4C|nr:ATP-binding protein [Noviherbaspirillum sp.]HJV86065.1 ATP-binding protein [Noviherbaspirillum sp.]